MRVSQTVLCVPIPPFQNTSRHFLPHVEKRRTNGTNVWLKQVSSLLGVLIVEVFCYCWRERRAWRRRLRVIIEGQPTLLKEASFFKVVRYVDKSFFFLFVYSGLQFFVFVFYFSLYAVGKFSCFALYVVGKFSCFALVGNYSCFGGRIVQKFTCLTVTLGLDIIRDTCLLAPKICGSSYGKTRDKHVC